MIRQKITATLVAALVVASCATGVRPDLSGMSISSKPLAGKIIWHDLVTEDMDSAKRFYSGLFDWTFTDSQTPGGQPYTVARSGNVYVAGIVAIAAPDDGAKNARWLSYMSVEDVDDTVATGLAAGATVAVSARNASLGRVAAIIDPEGAVIGLADSAFGDPDDATTARAESLGGRVILAASPELRDGLMAVVTATPYGMGSDHDNLR